MNGLIRLLQKAKFEIRSTIARKPSLSVLHRPLIWWQQYKILRYYQDKGASIKECVVGPHTEFVLDGFQGSANSFAANAFLASKDRPVMVSHHMHSPAQIIKAVRLGLSTLVTIRDPVGAALSLTCRWPFSCTPSPTQLHGLLGTLEPYTDGLLLSPFDLTTKHLDVVISAVNRRFDTDFDVMDASVENMKTQHGPTKRSEEEKRQREAIKARKSEELETPSGQRALKDAEAVYDRLKPHGVTL